MAFVRLFVATFILAFVGLPFDKGCDEVRDKVLGVETMCKRQKSAFPGVRAKGMTSRMLPTPVRNIRSRSKPSPNPACGTEP